MPTLLSMTSSVFRGVVLECELSLRPEPGLTFVVGRNGSGKSSFAENAAIKKLLVVVEECRSFLIPLRMYHVFAR